MAANRKARRAAMQPAPAPAPAVAKPVMILPPSHPLYVPPPDAPAKPAPVAPAGSNVIASFFASLDAPASADPFASLNDVLAKAQRDALADASRKVEKQLAAAIPVSRDAPPAAAIASSYTHHAFISECACPKCGSLSRTFNGFTRAIRQADGALVHEAISYQPDTYRLEVSKAPASVCVNCVITNPGAIVA